jgi:hypothetical protein
MKTPTIPPWMQKKDRFPAISPAVADAGVGDADTGR